MRGKLVSAVHAMDHARVFEIFVPHILCECRLIGAICVFAERKARVRFNFPTKFKNACKLW